MVRRRRGAVPESGYRARTTRGAAFFTSRREYEGLDAVIRRYPTSTEHGPVFVLVHGIGVSSRYFQPAAAELAKHGEVYLVDLPGYGSAPKTRRGRDVSIADHAAVLANVLRESELVDPLLVGHSMGSQVVSRLAVDSPEVSDRIVLMAPTLYPGYRTLGAAVARLLADIWREPLRVKAIAAVDYLVRCGIPYFLRQLPHLLEDRIEERLGDIRARTLVLRGDADVIVPVEWSRSLADLVPTGSFVEVAGPHVVMFTDPVSVAEAIAGHARGAGRRA
jgi:pimeloyl-ACP methyl ester carboxylesterase